MSKITSKLMTWLQSNPILFVFKQNIVHFLKKAVYIPVSLRDFSLDCLFKDHNNRKFSQNKWFFLALLVEYWKRKCSIQGRRMKMFFFTREIKKIIQLIFTIVIWAYGQVIQYELLIKETQYSSSFGEYWGSIPLGSAIENSCDVIGCKYLYVIVL